MSSVTKFGPEVLAAIDSCIAQNEQRLQQMDGCGRVVTVMTWVCGYLQIPIDVLENDDSFAPEGMTTWNAFSRALQERLHDSEN